MRKGRELMWRKPAEGTIEVIEVRRGECAAGLKVGDQFTFENLLKEHNFCIPAYQSLHAPLLALKYGAELPWEEDGATARICCPDPDCVVVFLLKRTGKVEPIEREQR